MTGEPRAFWSPWRAGVLPAGRKSYTAQNGGPYRSWGDALRPREE